MQGNERYFGKGAQAEEHSGASALVDIERLLTFLIQSAPVRIDGLSWRPVADAQLSSMGMTRKR